MGPPKTSAERTTVRRRRLPERVLTAASRWKWLFPGLATGMFVYYAYLVTHPYPAFGAGLFLYMAELTVRQPGLPEFIPHYTGRGVPFAYPPLMFFVNGLLLVAFDVDPVELARHLPHLASIAALVPFYLFGEELLDSRRQAGLATVLVAISPPVLQWQISAGGIVRGPAYLFTLAGLYTGLRLFREGGRRWLAWSTLWFALTVLTHPVYSVFYGLSYCWMYLSFDRSVRGLRDGVVVAGGAALLSSPWWLSVVRTHGPGVFTGAAGTHGGIGKRLPDLFALFAPGNDDAVKPVLFDVRPGLFDFTSFGMAVLSAWSVFFLLAWIYLLVDDDRPFLTGWLVLVVALVSKPRFTFAIGSLMGAAAYYRFLVPRVEDRLTSPRVRAAVTVGLSVAVVAAALGTGVAYAGSSLDSHAGSQSLPQFVDDDDVAAMEWAAGNTDPEAEFVVLGDAAEWFPYLTQRTILVGPWGVEWRGEAAYDRQLGYFNHLSTCEDAACLTSELRTVGVVPDYVYVPRDTYTVRGFKDTMPPTMRPSLLESDRYELVYQNEGAMIFAYEEIPCRSVEGANDPDAGTAEPGDDGPPPCPHSDRTGGEPAAGAVGGRTGSGPAAGVVGAVGPDEFASRLPDGRLSLVAASVADARDEWPASSAADAAQSSDEVARTLAETSPASTAAELREVTAGTPATAAGSEPLAGADDLVRQAATRFGHGNATDTSLTPQP